MTRFSDAMDAVMDAVCGDPEVRPDVAQNDLLDELDVDADEVYAAAVQSFDSAVQTYAFRQPFVHGLLVGAALADSPARLVAQRDLLDAYLEVSADIQAHDGEAVQEVTDAALAAAGFDVEWANRLITALSEAGLETAQEVEAAEGGLTEDAIALARLPMVTLLLTGAKAAQG